MREFVADVGNTRIKWGLAASEGLFRSAAVPLDDPEAWSRQLDEWNSTRPSTWTLAGTHPEARDRLADWLKRRGDDVHIIDRYQQIPLSLRVDHPEQVGIDRLLNALAVLQRVPRGMPAVIVGAGSAVTVDLVDGDGIFRGGAIFPGFRLMARALNDYTARLPRIESFPAHPSLPGTNTVAAIQAGISNAVIGGIERILAQYAVRFGKARIFIAGGDAELLVDLPGEPEMAGPYLTLEGIRIAARELS